MIICCTYAQTKTFADVECLEMNLFFKMIQKKVNVFFINE